MIEGWTGIDPARSQAMSIRHGIASARWMRDRPAGTRGGLSPWRDGWDRSHPASLALWHDRYLGCLSARNYSPGTIEGRRNALKTFLKWCAARELMIASQITRSLVESYQQWLWCYRRPISTKPLGWSTQRQKISTVKDWFRWMARQGVIPVSPAENLELPRMEKHLPVSSLSQRQVKKLLRVPDTADPLGIRNRAMLELFYSSGLRRAELCALELPDFQPQARLLHIRMGKGKKDRFVPIGERAIAWIRSYLEQTRPLLVRDSAHLFLTCYGDPFHPDVVSRMVREFMKEAGFPGRGSCHQLRHACATHMLEGGADIRFIQQLLGHEKLETTAIYTEVTIRQLQDVFRKCHPAAQLKKDEIIGADTVDYEI